MTYASAFERDIFISYCHTDNENPLGRGWIEVFHEALLIKMRQILGARTSDEEPSIWRDARLQGNEEFSDVLAGELRKVALVISVLTPSYVRSDWCQREIAEFCQAAAQRGGLVVGNKARIFKVMKTPVDRERHPAPLQGQIGYPFFVVDPATKMPREFTLAPGDSQLAKALEIINELAYHIKDTLDEINRALHDGPAAPPAATAAAVAPVRRCVYLAETSFDLDDERNQVRRDLEARGLCVLPDNELPIRRPDQFRDAVAAALARCDLSVHLIGRTRSAVPAGQDDGQDTVSLQNQMAAEACGGSTLKRLIWIPSAAEPGDDVQQKFIAKLHTDPAAQRGAEVLTNPLQDLIARIHDRLHQLDAPKPVAAPAAPGAARRIYLIAHPNDAALSDPLREHLFDSGFEVLDSLTDPSASAAELFEAHKMNLVDCDAVLVCYGSANEFWLKSQMSDAQRALGWREGRPLLARAIAVGPPQTPAKQRLRSNDFLILDLRASPEPSAVEPLLALLRRT